jgi:hypothetical protein
MPRLNTARLSLRALAPFVLLLVAYVALRLRAFVGVDPTRFHDTGSYEVVANKSWFDPAFYASIRGWTLPALYRIIDGDTGRIIAQFLISTVSWAVLAGVVARNIEHRVVRVAAFAVILAFGASFYVTSWDGMLLSESLSLSLTALLIAAWIELVRAPRWRTLLVVLALTVLWAFTRDTNAFLALLTAIAVALLFRVPSPRRFRWAAAGALALIFVGVGISADSPNRMTKRWRVPMIETVTQRVMPDRDGLAYFKDAGMPVRPELERVTNSWDKGDGWFRDPKISDYKRWQAMVGDAQRYWSPLQYPEQSKEWDDWIVENGRRTYARFLLTHPVDTTVPVVRYSDELFGPPQYGLGREALTHPVDTVVYPHAVVPLAVFLVVVLGVAAVAVVRHGTTRVMWIPIVILALTPLHAAFVWHSEPVDVGRHAHLVGVLLRLGAILLLAFAVDLLLSRRRRGDATASDSGAGDGHREVGLEPEPSGTSA